MGSKYIIDESIFLGAKSPLYWIPLIELPIKTPPPQNSNRILAWDSITLYFGLGYHFNVHRAF